MDCWQLICSATAAVMSAYYEERIEEKKVSRRKSRQVSAMGGPHNTFEKLSHDNSRDDLILVALPWLALRPPTHSALTKRKFAAPHNTWRLGT